MKKYLQRVLCLCLYLTALITLPSNVLVAQAVNAGEQQAIKDVITQFYQGWNTRDVEKMVSFYADDIDHVNAFGEWQTGKQVMKQALTQFLADRTKNIHKTITIEKIRFLKPDVAVAIVRQISTVGNVGTYILSKESGKWLVVNFANVPYKLQPKEAKVEGKK